MVDRPVVIPSHCEEDLVCVGTKTITENGTYHASADDVDGYEAVVVNVSPNVGSKTITEDGVYNASADGFDGYATVVVNVRPEMTERLNFRVDPEDSDSVSLTHIPLNGETIIVKTKYVGLATEYTHNFIGGTASSQADGDYTISYDGSKQFTIDGTNADPEVPGLILVSAEYKY